MTDQSTAKLTAPDFKKQNNRALTAFDYDTGEVVTLYLKSASGILMNGYAFGSSNPKDTHLTYYCNNRYKGCGSICSASFCLF